MAKAGAIEAGSEVLTGKVQWFSGAKGFGFIAKDDGSGDIFVHFSELKGIVGYKTLESEQRVSFRIGKGEDGRPLAVDVFVLEEE